ncbi:MAG: PH domain-containing protein [Acidobacteriota bacterium]
MSAQTAREFRPVRVRRSPLLIVAMLVTVAIPFVYLLVAWLGAPRQIWYEIDTRQITIHTAKGFAGDVKQIPLSRLDDASPAWLRDGELQFGTVKGGYCVGFFRYPSLGEVWQATDCADEGVVIRAGGETHPIVIAPHDRDGFIAALKSVTPGKFMTAERPRGISWPLFVTLALLLWPLAAVLAVDVFVAPRRLRYRVKAGALEVQTMFSTQTISLSRTKARSHQPLLGQRLSGLGLPGYYSGTFMFDHAATTVAATTQQEGVLIEGDTRIFVSPATPQEFLAALAAAGTEVV